MNQSKTQERILEAIDQLRKRKARPDIQRICNFLLRRFSISWNETKECLQRCIDEQIVLRVEYKGSISYRIALRKPLQLQRDRQGNGTNPAMYPRKNFSELLTNAIAELIVYEPDYLELGVPRIELIHNILAKDNLMYTPNYVRLLLEEEVKSGGLIRTPNGNYLVGPARSEEYIRKESQRNRTAEVPFVMGNARKKLHRPLMKKKKPFDVEERRNFDGTVRVGSRRKRAKKVFDPSDTHVPKKRGRPSTHAKSSSEHKVQGKSNENDKPEINREQGGVCSVCHNNKKVPNDRFVSCRECINKAHVSCLNGDDMMLRMHPDNTWQCPHCKTCVVCYETSDAVSAGDLVVCSVCADAYHMMCHEPNIVEKVKSDVKWMCINCQMPEQLQVNEIHPNAEIFKDLNETPQSVSSDESNTMPSPPPSPTPPTLSPQASRNGIKSSSSSPDVKLNLYDSYMSKDIDIEDLVDPSIPDASDWTHEDVYNYFVQYFPEEASVFKENEIDGQSLLLMKRMDVLTSLKLKLGPALKIYRHVVKLQFRRDDPKLYWV